MELQQRQRQEAKLILTHAMRQSLAVLRMPLTELQEYVESALLDNPLLDVGEREMYSNKDGSDVLLRDSSESEGCLLDWRSCSQGVIRDVPSLLSEESFTEMLVEQLMEIRGKASRLLPLCYYLIYCLDEKGYLRFKLEELAIEQHVTLKQMKEALAIVQSLQPAGVGACTLEECLLLQAQRKKLGTDVEFLIKQGLEFLAKKDYKRIEMVLDCTRKRVEYIAEIVRGLNPIPSQGYKTENLINYQVPEAEIKIENDAICIEVNDDFLPRPQLNKNAEKLLLQSGEKTNQEYLKDKVEKAKNLLSSLQNRENTIHALLIAIAKKQAGFFLRNEVLVPFTMSQMAKELGVSNSTISRAVQGKTIVFKGHIIVLKELFVVGIVQREGIVSTNGIKQKLKQLIMTEDSKHPLSDEALSTTLSANQLTVSRRTVAKDREALGIATSGVRKRQKNNK